jgi:benzoyl-CoA reductase/2-hydroxyglutaryl-CoA dehydratase subunit BcrC/BadD/HgdB
MIELLKLCGYEDAEIQKEFPRVEKAFKRMGITAGDIELGKQRIHRYYDTELYGVRKIFRLCMREFVDSILARDEGKTRLIYGFMAPYFEVIGAAVMSGSPEVYSANHYWAFMMITGCLFDKTVTVLEAAEKKWLKAGAVAHCGNVKVIAGAFALDLFPKPDLMVTSGSLCETAPKTFDILHEIYDIPVYFFEACQDRESREYAAASKRIVEFEAKSLKKMFERIKETVGFEITDKMLRDVLEARKKMDAALGRMRKLLVSSDPLPLSPTHENLWTCLNSLTLSISGLQEATDAINTLCEELQERINKGIGVLPKGSPRIVAMCPAQHADPRLEHLINESGIAVVAIDFSFGIPYPEIPRNPDTVLALTLQGSPFTCTAQRVPLIIERCKQLKVDGVFDRYHSGCRTVVGDALLVKEAVEKEVGIPVLLLEWENYDPRYFHYEEYKKKLEVFKEIMLNKASYKATK